MSACNFSQFSQFFIKGTCKLLLVIAFILCGLLSVASAQNRFVHVPSYPAGGSLPTLLAQHDVNGDGKPDLIVMNINSTTQRETFSLLLGTGTGGYQAPKVMAYVPVSYGKPLLADVNRDGRLDLIFSSGKPQITRVYLGQGEGFQPTAVVSKGGGCPINLVCSSSDIQVADLNKDGNPDLLVLVFASAYNSTLYVSLGNGNGSFRAPAAIDASVNAFTTGDFNSDGLLDIATAGGSGVPIWLGNGDGTFRKGPSQFQLGGGQILSADLRGNGKTDLILVTAFTSAQVFPGECRGGGVAVFLGNGDGTFAVNGSWYRVGQYTYGAVIADMNGDHRPDIVAANQLGGSYSVLLNAGSGKFSAAVNYRAPEPRDGNFVVGDLNGDGRPDLTISSQTGVEVLRNTGGGRLLAPVSLDLQAGAEPLQTIASDLNHDGIPDLALLANIDTASPCFMPYDFGDGHVFLSGNAKAFSSLTKFGLPGSYPSSFGLGDFNRDGSTDLAVDASPRGLPPDFNIQFNNGRGQFPTQGPTISPTETFNAPYYDIAVGDFNRDGFADVVLNGQPLVIGLGAGNGNFSFKSYSALGIPDTIPTVVRDINGDGKLDLINVDNAGDVVEVLLGNGDGTFQTPKKYATAQGPVGIAIADFNRDGKLDLAVAGGSEVSLLLNNGNGTFKPAVNYPAGGPASAIAAISLFGNGNQGVLVADTKDKKIFLLAGDGKGTLAAPVYYYPGSGNPSVNYFAGGYPTALTVADFNGDGAPDVVVSEPATSSYMVLYNTGGTYIKLATSNANPAAGQAVTFTATVAASIAGTGTPSGTVAFKNGPTTLGTVSISGGKATFSTAALSRGTQTMTVSYYGSTSFNPHSSGGMTETVH